MSFDKKASGDCLQADVDDNGSVDQHFFRKLTRGNFKKDAIIWVLFLSQNLKTFRFESWNGEKIKNAQMSKNWERVARMTYISFLVTFH